MAYDLMHPKAPRLSGATLEIFAALLERPLLGKLPAKRLLKAAGIDRFRRLHVPEPPRLQPIVDTTPGEAGGGSGTAVRKPEAAGGSVAGFRYAGIDDYAEA